MPASKASQKRYELAKSWLAGALSDHQPHVVGGLLAAGAREGHAEQQLRRARRLLGVREFNASMGFGRAMPTVMMWQLPQKEDGAA